jgi:glutaredoxin
MKRLLYKNKKYYLSDELDTPLGKTYITDYIASKDNMPHNYYKNNIVMYARNTCPYCIDTLDFFSKQKKLYKKLIFVEIDTEPLELLSKSNLLSIMHDDIKGHSTVPIVFNNGVFIGGSDKTKAYFSKSE